MLEAMQEMVRQAEAQIADAKEKIVEQRVALARMEGYRMALADLIATYQKLEKQNVENPA